MRTARLLVLKTGDTLPFVRAHCGDFEDWIARGLGRSLDAVEVVSVHRGEALPAIGAVDGVVVTGSPAMVSERADWSERTARWLAEVVAEDAAAVLGLCYGHQLLAHALGGEVGPNPRGREMGTLEVVLGAGVDEGRDLGPLFEAGRFRGHFSHVEAVLRPPADARILAGTALDPHSAIAYGPRQWGVQFHPEFDGEIMRRYVEARREVLAREAFDPDAMIAAVVETPEINVVLTRFASFVEGR
jgi:GMP synthase (glutamine-hydrolysing)